MWQRLSQVTISKPAALAVVLLVSIMPWFQGGKDPIGWMVLLGVGLLGGFIAWRSQDNQVRIGSLGWVWLSLIAWTALSLTWTVNRFQTVSWLILWIFVGLVFVLASVIKKKAQYRDVFVNGYLLVAAIASLYGIGLFVFETYDRATSTFYLANPFAGFLLAAVIIGLWRFAERNRLWDGLLTMVNLSAFILADSRAAGLALVIVLFLGLWLSRRTFRHWRRLLIILVGALALTLIFNLLHASFSHHFTLQGTRLTEVAEGRSTSGSDRIYYLRSALAIWAERPLQGWGAGTYSTMHPQYQYRVISASRDAHNFFIQSLSELGLVGFALIAWLTLMVLIGLWRGIKADQELIPIALASLALLIHFGLDIDASYPVLLALAAILIAICYHPKSSTAKQTAMGAKVVPLGLVLAVVLAFPVIQLYRGTTYAQSAESWQELGDYEKALTKAQVASGGLIYNPDWVTVKGISYFSLAIFHLDEAVNLKNAAAAANIAERQDPHDAQHYYLLAQVMEMQGNPAASENQYKTAIRLDPYDNPQYYNSLAALYLQENKLNLADQTASIVTRLYTDQVIRNRSFDVKLPPKVATSLVIRALIAQKLGRIDIARSFVADALKLDPMNADAKKLSLQIGQ